MGNAFQNVAEGLRLPAPENILFGSEVAVTPPARAAEQIAATAPAPLRAAGGEGVLTPEQQIIDLHRQNAANAAMRGDVSLEELRLARMAGGQDEAVFVAANSTSGRDTLAEWLNEQRRLGATEFSTNWQTPNRVLVEGEAAPTRTGNGFIRWGYEDHESGRIPVLTGIQGRGGRGGTGFFERMVEDGVIEDAGTYTTALGEERHLYRIPDEAAANVRYLTPPLADGAVPSLSRALDENMEGVEDLFTRLEDRVRSDWGNLQTVTSNPQVERAIGEWANTAEGRVAEARLVAGQVANGARDFTLLNYQGRRYFDLALGYIYPYQFWYSRTYAHWLQRLGTAPEVIAAYAKYREYLESVHAGAPDWWKYNINSNELLGIDSENPLFFNLEATLNPLNGLLGVDFNDPARRVNWWTAMLDDLGKFGPSTWTPFSIATALALYASGENEAAARWGGRLIPQTATLRAATSLLGANGGQGWELDPSVLFFSGGTDPYERRRVGRALSAMVNEGIVSEADALDAGRLQRGPIWDQARARATQERAPGQLASFFLGVGFRGRSTSDMMIDQFYADYYRLLGMEPNLSPDEFRTSMDRLRTQYPFMDTLLLSRGGGDDRDRAYAYNVLARLPPGQSSDYAEWAGIPSELMDRFYNDKGHIESWSEADRSTFMGAILRLGTSLEVPPDGVRSEWTEARNRYGQMLQEGRNRYGKDIWDRVDAWYGARGETPQEQATADAMMQADPQIEQALDFKAQYVMDDQVLSLYYGGLENVRSFYTGQMYDLAERTWPTIWEDWDEYYRLRQQGESTGQFWDSHPQLQEYMDLRDRYDQIIAQEQVRYSEMFPDRPVPELRAGAAEGLPLGEPGLPQMTLDQWGAILGQNTMALIDDYIAGEALPSAVLGRLDALAEDMGLDSGAVILELIRRAPYAQ
jgi:hypothetical protein